MSQQQVVKQPAPLDVEAFMKDFKHLLERFTPGKKEMIFEKIFEHRLDIIIPSIVHTDHKKLVKMLFEAVKITEEEDGKMGLLFGGFKCGICNSWENFSPHFEKCSNCPTMISIHDNYTCSVSCNYCNAQLCNKCLDNGIKMCGYCSRKSVE